MQTTDSDKKLSAIDKALAAAKARKALRDSTNDDSSPSANEGAKEPKAKKVTHPGFDKSQKKEALTLAREAAKQARDAERQKRRAEKASAASNNKPAHMKKVETAGSKLPSLSDTAQSFFNDVTTRLNREQMTAFALHLQHFNRLKATEKALSQRVEAGAKVRIIGGDPKFIGLQGTVDRAQRIRCYVNVPSSRRPVYLFTSDVEVVGNDQDEAIAGE